MIIRTPHTTAAHEINALAVFFISDNSLQLFHIYLFKCLVQKAVQLKLLLFLQIDAALHGLGYGFSVIFPSALIVYCFIKLRSI